MSLRRLAIALAAVVLGASLVLWGAGGASPRGIKPQPGTWKVTIVKGGTGNGTGGSFTVNNGAFTVSSNRKTVSRFGFSFAYSGAIKPPSRVGSGRGATVSAK